MGRYHADLPGQRLKNGWMGGYRGVQDAKWAECLGFLKKTCTPPPWICLDGGVQMLTPVNIRLKYETNHIEGRLMLTTVNIREKYETNHREKIGVKNVADNPWSRTSRAWVDRRYQMGYCRSMRQTLSITDPNDTRCSVVAKNGDRCPYPKELGTAYCEIHRPLLLPGNKRESPRYGRFLPDPLKKLYYEMLDDRDFFSLLEEVALHRTLLCDYLERMANHKNELTGMPEPLAPDPQVVTMHTEIIRRQLESQKGRKYIINTAGVAKMMDIIGGILVTNLADQPERLRAILSNVRALEFMDEMDFDKDRPRPNRVAAGYPDTRNNKYGAMGKKDAQDVEPS